MSTKGTAIRLAGLRSGHDYRGTRFDRYTRAASLDDAITKARRMLAANDRRPPTSVRIDWLYRIGNGGARIYKARLLVTAEGVAWLWETDAWRTARGAR